MGGNAGASFSHLVGLGHCVFSCLIQTLLITQASPPAVKSNGRQGQHQVRAEGRRGWPGTKRGEGGGGQKAWRDGGAAVGRREGWFTCQLPSAERNGSSPMRGRQPPAPLLCLKGQAWAE